jgi:hypothetical protein
VSQKTFASLFVLAKEDKQDKKVFKWLRQTTTKVLLLLLKSCCCYCCEKVVDVPVVVVLVVVDVEKLKGAYNISKGYFDHLKPRP